MPRRSLRCIVDLHLHAVSAPGVWLPSKEEVYLSVSLFNQYRNTACHASIFPILINEKFRFEKTYYTAVDPAQVAEILEDELIIFELVQLSEYTDGAVRLASFSTNARDFLYPYPSLAPNYSSHDREVLMSRTIAFPGISPKLEFSTKTVIKEVVNYLDDAEEYGRRSRSTLRSRTARSRCPNMMQEDSGGSGSDWDLHLSQKKHSPCRQLAKQSAEDGCPPHYCLPTVTSLSRSRSLSPRVRRKLADISLDNSIDTRPPFVVRKENVSWNCSQGRELDDSLIGRTPSSSTERLALSTPKRSQSPRPRSNSVLDTLNLSTSAKPKYNLTTVIRKPHEEPLPVFKPRYSSAYDDDVDKEVEGLTSVEPTYVSPRVRSVSPLLYRSSFRDRYGSYLHRRPYSSLYYDSLLDWELERIRERRLARLYNYYGSLDDLELELKLARLRASRY